MKKDRLDSPAVISARIKEIRVALGFETQAAFSEPADVDYKSQSNYENGFRIGLDAAIKYCEKYHLSLDYIYFGETANLPGKVTGPLERHRAAVAADIAAAEAAAAEAAAAALAESASAEPPAAETTGTPEPSRTRKKKRPFTRAS